jgi:lipoprotein-anchoring transpeptidase ErfK/SrfK
VAAKTFFSVKRPVYQVMVLFLSGCSLPGYTDELQPASPPTSVAAPAVSTPAPTAAPVVSTPQLPDGFVKRVLKKGETLAKICCTDSTTRIIFMKVNRLDERHFPTGKEVLIPVDINKAMLYTPVPATITDSRGEREIRVFIDRQYFGAYEGGKLLFWGPVSSGKKEKPTPPGKFFVNYKERFRRSLKYENAPMPFSINYNNGFFMHQQSLPGRPASHGCIRLLQVDAERLFFWAQRRDPVTVVNN